MLITGLMGIAFMSFMGIKYGKDKPKDDKAQASAVELIIDESNITKIV